MSKDKKEKVIHVDKLIIHAKNVEIINERKEHKEDHHSRRDPWGIFWGRKHRDDVYKEEWEDNEEESKRKDDND